MYFSREMFRKIRDLLIVLGYVCSLFIFSQCEDESANPRSYPRVGDLSVTNISENGVVFSANITSIGTEPVLQHGFVWSTANLPSIDYNNRIFLGAASRTGSFSAEISTTLQKGLRYTVKPFIQSAEHTVYGNPAAFMSLGSQAPVIEGFEPKTGRWLDTLVIRGKNFSYLAGENQVKLNAGLCNVVSATDSTLKVLVSTGLIETEGILSVTIAGNVATYTESKFNLHLPLPEDFTPKEARWGDTIKITGKYLYTSSLNYSYSGKIGGYPFTFIEKKDDYLLIKVPNEVNVVQNIIDLKINGLTYVLTNKFSLNPPVLTSISPKQGTWGNIITLTGNFHPLTTRSSVFFDNLPATIISNSAREIKVQVPATLSKTETNIIYKATPFTTTSLDTFRLKGPVIKTFSPLSGPGSTVVTINGKYFKYGNTTVLFGTTAGIISSMNDSIIKVNVPNRVYGAIRITVKVNSLSVISTSDFDVTNPKINSVYPLSGTFNDWITITGENFVSTSGGTGVYFGSSFATIKDLNNNSLLVQVPSTIDSVPQVISVRVSANDTEFQDKFILSPPEILSIAPSVIEPGQDITITGLNFNPVLSKNMVYLDIYPLVIKSCSSTSIVATIPTILPRGGLKIKVIAGGYVAKSSQEFVFDSKWLRIPAPSLKTNIGGVGSFLSVAGGGISDFGYFCSVVDNGLTYRFDPTNHSWTKLNTQPKLNLRYNLDQIVFKDTFYIIAGLPAVLNGIDQISETWKQKPISMDYTSDGIVFSLNNKIYFGYKSDYSYSTSAFYEIDPSNNYSKTNTTVFPISISASRTANFSIGNKGYVLFSNNNFWQFDATNLQWTRLADFPGPARFHAVSFVIGEFGYMGTGINGNQIYNDIWKYNPSIDSWTMVSLMPNPRCKATAIVIKDKAYIGFGRFLNSQYTMDLFDFYEFDPNYTMK